MKDVKITLEEDKTDLICEKCGRQMVVKVGRYGKFIACPGYPECKNIKKFVKETGAECPKCGGRVIEKKTKKAGYSMAATIIRNVILYPGMSRFRRSVPSAARPF